MTDSHIFLLAHCVSWSSHTTHCLVLLVNKCIHMPVNTTLVTRGVEPLDLFCSSVSDPGQNSVAPGGSGFGSVLEKCVSPGGSGSGSTPLLVTQKELNVPAHISNPQVATLCSLYGSRLTSTKPFNINEFISQRWVISAGQQKLVRPAERAISTALVRYIPSDVEKAHWRGCCVLANQRNICGQALRYCTTCMLTGRRSGWWVWRPVSLWIILLFTTSSWRPGCCCRCTKCSDVMPFLVSSRNRPESLPVTIE